MTWYVCERRERHAGFVWNKLKERDRFEDLNMDWEYNSVKGLKRNEWNNLNRIRPVQKI